MGLLMENVVLAAASLAENIIMEVIVLATAGMLILETEDPTRAVE